MTRSSSPITSSRGSRSSAKCSRRSMPNSCWRRRATRRRWPSWRQGRTECWCASRRSPSASWTRRPPGDAASSLATGSAMTTCPSTSRHVTGSSSPTSLTTAWTRSPTIRWRCCWQPPAASSRRRARSPRTAGPSTTRAIHRLAGRRLALIGLGGIGRRVAARAQAFGLEVIGFDPFLDPFDVPGVGPRQNARGRVADRRLRLAPRACHCGEHQPHQSGDRSP